MVERLRGRAGVAQRKRRVALYPLCAECLKQGRVTATDEIDHKIRLDDGGLDTDENCQGLCTEHHKVKTRRENTGKHGYDETGRPLDPAHPWNARQGGGQKFGGL